VPYFIQTFDKAGSEDVRSEHRRRHLDYLEATKAKLLACGAKLGETDGKPTGGIYLLDVDTFAEAKAYIEADPFSEVGLFREVSIEPWRKAFLDGKSFV
jgi:uncharacterized protein YciI